MRRLLVSLALSLLPFALPAQQDARPAAADTAKLTFRWPAVTHARVEAQRYRERHSNGKHDTSNVRVTYRMSAQRSADEYVVRFSDFQLPQSAAPVAGFAERLSALVPSYRVTASGEFTGLESPGTIRAFIDSMLTSLTAKDGPPPPQLKQFMNTMLSDAVLTASAAQEWNALVGTWIGAELEVGEVYGSEGEEPVPIFQNAAVKFEYEFSAVRRIPCDSVATPKARDCVELQMVSRPDSAAMRTLLQRFMGTLMPDAAKDVGFTDFDVENVVTLVARPESLLPVSLVVTKEVAGTVREGGKTEKVYQLDVKSQKYTYER
jgi:hypothetical protein